MAQLTGFDYLRASRPLLLQRLAALRIPAQLQAGTFALASALLAVAGAAGIERHRLLQAQRTEALYRRHCEIADREVKRANLYGTRVAALVALDRRVRLIEGSGESASRRLAAIANRLPAHAWLTSISHRGTTVELEGETQNMRIVGSLLRAFANAGVLRNPVLSTAAAASDAPGERRMKYSLTAETTP